MAGFGPPSAATNTHLIETERLLLSVPDRDDAARLFELAGGEHRGEVTAGLLWDGPDEIAETKRFIEIARTATYGEHGFHWAVRDRKGSFGVEPWTPLGMVGTRPLSDPGRGDVGYWLGRPYWGQGIMTEALTAVLDLCFGELDMVKLEAEIFVDNSRSARLVERLGMRREGTIRSAHHKRGNWVDVNIYGILRDEWLASRSS